MERNLQTPAFGASRSFCSLLGDLLKTLESSHDVKLSSSSGDFFAGITCSDSQLSVA